MARSLPRSPEADLLREWLHPARSDRPGSRVPGGALGRMAADPALARALPVLAGALDRHGALAGLAQADRLAVVGHRAQSERRVEAMAQALDPLGVACARERLPVFLVKGAALHGLLYPDPTWRPADDVDLFVPVEHVGRFHDVLERLGFVPDAHSHARVEACGRTGARRPWLVDLAYAAPGGEMVVEVKSDPVAVGRAPARIGPFTEGATPSPVYPGLLVPAAETQAIQQAFSIARRPAPDLLAHAELAGVLWTRRAELDPRRLLDLLAGEGLYGILRGVLDDTEAAFPGVVPTALLVREGRPAGWTPPRLRRGTFAKPRPETGWTRLSFWAAPALGGGRPLATLAWLKDRVLPPQPLLAALTDGREGFAAVGARLRTLAGRG